MRQHVIAESTDGIEQGNESGSGDLLDPNRHMWMQAMWAQWDTFLPECTRGEFANTAQAGFASSERATSPHTNFNRPRGRSPQPTPKMLMTAHPVEHSSWSQDAAARQWEKRQILWRPKSQSGWVKGPSRRKQKADTYSQRTSWTWKGEASEQTNSAEERPPWH